MYHGIIAEDSNLPEEREIGADLYDVRVEDFKNQMQLIRTRGLAVKKIEHADEKDIIITFDDGELNNFQSAMPILKEHQFPAYFFIITKRIGHPGYMSIDDIREMSKQGMIIGSHGMSHEILTNLKDTQISEELSASKKYLERNLGIEIHDLSIPRGFCNDNVLAIAKEAGYKNIFISSRPKDLTDEGCCSRIAVKKSWKLKRFEMALNQKIPLRENFIEKTKNVIQMIFHENGYNWLRSSFLKVFKG